MRPPPDAIRVVAALGRGARVSKRLEIVDVEERARLGDVAPVEQHVHAYALHALSVGLLEHRLQVTDVRVHVAVREQADEVQRLAGLAHAPGESSSRPRCEELPVVDRLAAPAWRPGRRRAPRRARCGRPRCCPCRRWSACPPPRRARSASCRAHSASASRGSGVRAKKTASASSFAPIPTRRPSRR